MKNTFQDLWVRWPWRPIRNCPGRFGLPRTEHPISFETLLGTSCVPQVFSSLEAKDCVLVMTLEDDGLISYRQADGLASGHAFENHLGFLVHIVVVVCGATAERAGNDGG